MENGKIDIIINKFLEGKCNKEELLTLKTWLDKDKNNVERFVYAKNIYDNVNPVFNPEDINTNEAHKLFMQKTSSNNVRVLYHRFSKIAAFFLIPLFLTSIYFFISSRSETNESYNEILASNGAISRVVLPDSSIVWLNAGSRLKYPLSFNKKKRNVYLSGEAYFSVKSDKSNPFSVYVDDLSVKATGTEFNVEAYENDTSIYVTLVEGKVSVSMVEHNERYLLEGARLAFNKYAHQYSVENVNTERWSSWRTGKLLFRNDRLDYVMKKLSRRFDKKIVIKDDLLFDEMCWASFDNESFEEIMSLLKLTMPMDYKISRNNNSDDLEVDLVEIYYSCK